VKAGWLSAFERIAVTVDWAAILAWIGDQAEHPRMSRLVSRRAVPTADSFPHVNQYFR
jgi:hypothetical protein